MNQIVLVGSVAIFICSVCYKFSTLYQRKIDKRRRQAADNSYDIDSYDDKEEDDSGDDDLDDDELEQASIDRRINRLNSNESLISKQCERKENRRQYTRRHGIAILIALVGPMLLHGESCLLILLQRTEKKDGTTRTLQH